jgi:hypothetical protein
MKWLLTSVLLLVGTGQLHAAFIYFDNFDGNQAAGAGVSATFAGYFNLVSVQGYAGIGTGSNIFSGNLLQNDSGGVTQAPQTIPPQLTSLTLTGLPAHTSVDLHFLLAVINSWDGLPGTHGFAGGDYFNVTIDGNTVFSYAFDNFYDFNQTYIPPIGVQLTSRPFADLGFPDPNGQFADSAYNLGLDPVFSNIPHTSSTITIDWFASGPGWQGGTDESWGMDNLSISVNSVPEPASVTMLAIAGLCLLEYSRRRRGTNQPGRLRG